MINLTNTLILNGITLEELILFSSKYFYHHFLTPSLTIQFISIDFTKIDPIYNFTTIQNFVVEKLILKYDRIQEYAISDIIEIFPSLNTLYLEEIQVIQSPILESIDQIFTDEIKQPIRYFSIINSGLQSLGTIPLLYSVQKIEVISLANNNLTYIDNQYFFPKYSSKFWLLDLSGNNIFQLNYWIPETIQVLHLENNQLSMLSTGEFEQRSKSTLELWLFGMFSC